MGEDYQGARSLDALEHFANDTLNKKCVVGSEEEMAKFCSDKEQQYAKKMMDKTTSKFKNGKVNYKLSRTAVCGQFRLISVL